MSEDRIEDFLIEFGFESLLTVFIANEITTVRSLRTLNEEDFMKIGCTSLIANLIMRKLNDTQQYSRTELHKREVVYLNQQFEETNELSELRNKLEIKNAELLNIKKEAELKAIIKEKEYEGKVKLLELKIENLQCSLAQLKGTLDTVLLNIQYYEIIQAWLCNPHCWSLKYRGTRDGFSAKTFHNLSNMVGSTITIVLSTSGYLFGGYNPNTWSSSQTYQCGKGSFIFTLKNPFEIEPTPFYWRSGGGPYDIDSYGPTWGEGYDLHIADDCNENDYSYSHFPQSYKDTLGYGINTFTGSENFTISEIEVFSVMV